MSSTRLSISTYYDSCCTINNDNNNVVNINNNCFSTSTTTSTFPTTTSTSGTTTSSKVESNRWWLDSCWQTEEINIVVDILCTTRRFFHANEMIFIFFVVLFVAFARAQLILNYAVLNQVLTNLGCFAVGSGCSLRNINAGVNCNSGNPYIVWFVNFRIFFFRSFFFFRFFFHTFI